MTRIIERHRVAALLGVALLVLPIAASSLVGTRPAQAAAAQGSGTALAQGSFAAIVSADKPAVVTITTTLKAENASADGISPFGGTSPFDQQFRDFFGERQMPMPEQRPSGKAEALGSGFILTGDGYIVTNNHVIDKASTIRVTLDDGTELPAKLVGADPKSDLAVLKIDSGKSLATIAWGESDKLRAGDPILAIGNPFGIGTTVTAGIVSARGRDLHSGPYDDFIQIDAPINHGNSGGPLVGADGTVVGINTAIYSPNGGSVGVGFAIPSDQAQRVVARLMKDGSIEHGFIGVQIQPVTSDVADAIGLAKPAGALVAKVDEGTPAAAAGIRSGDVITMLDGKAVNSPRELSRIVADLAPGTKEGVTVWRDGSDKNLSITIGNNDDGDRQVLADAGGKSGEAAQRVPTIGVQLGDLTADMRQSLGLPKGESGAVVEGVNPDKPAAEMGLQPGDVILSVNQKPVTSAREAKAAVAEAGKAGRKAVLLLVQRQDEQSFVTVPFAAG
ncbi:MULTISPECIES: DegQ family serine endoprotease [unclassified Shinella]|jgi:serine protease Do|uniref:DegQ family serine endoprotease n=1 Tax=unclassified Shinella TaxID=2643062 RepID=UPI00234F7BC3|nr:MULTISPECIES: DegQ family serine endoprotease [unclassified Shinella]MCO5149144.1 DegQ family serine endoprotease [Shinella sp.]MDC7265202.1 DegQ family serine endoprotease [Shinella sp. HY16]MDC7272099.1 DegQ family serine endoprotease [Shinella sp. YZ44]